MLRNSWFWIAMVWIIVGSLLLWSPDARSCQWNDCQDKLVGDNPVQAITNEHRQRVGDIYDPGNGRLQIRNNSRQIIGYITLHELSKRRGITVNKLGDVK